MQTEATTPTREAISTGATLDERLAAYFARMEHIRTHCPDCDGEWTDGERCPHCGLGVWDLDAAATMYDRNQEEEERMYMEAFEPNDRPAPRPRPERVQFGPQQTVNGRGTIVATCGSHTLRLVQQVRGDGDSWCLEQPQRLPDGTIRLVTGRWLNLVEVKAEARIAFTHITGEQDGVLQFDRDAIFRDYDAWRRR
jgi:hypothetical protein